MNLVAKEFVAARDDEQGVLMLSSFAGASRELAEARDRQSLRHAWHGQGLRSRLRMRRRGTAPSACAIMCGQIGERNVYLWAAQMLLDAAWLRRREKVASAARR